MARPKISLEFRSRLSEKLMDLGNLVFAGLVIGQFLPGIEFSAIRLAGGVIFTLSCYITSYILINR